MRNLRISEGEYYHVFNRGVNKQVIFHDFGDYTRFLFLILHLQFSGRIEHLSRVVKEFARSFGQYGQSGQHSVLATSNVEAQERNVELVAFSLMPNHFHLLLKQTAEGGISSYMHRVLNAYGKYHNTKHDKSGHVFQGPYKAVHVGDDVHLMHLSAYIHRNPRELNEWLTKEDRYPWSSYQDYVRNSRWGNLLIDKVIMERFESKDEYEKFVETSAAKLSEEERAALSMDI